MRTQFPLLQIVNTAAKYGNAYSIATDVNTDLECVNSFPLAIEVNTNLKYVNLSFSMSLTIYLLESETVALFFSSSYDGRVREKMKAFSGMRSYQRLVNISYR